MIPLIKLPLNEDDAQAVADCVKSGQIGLGDDVFKFEKALAEYVGARYVVTTDSCTSALFLSVKYQNPAYVEIPSMTVPLVANAIMEAGADLILDDRTDWVGNSYRLKGTSIFDSAHELHRDCYKEYPKGSVLCFSFYPTKPIGSADGGAIVTDSKGLADWARSMSCYGRNQSTKYQDSWEYEVDLIGYKRHYTNLQAVLCHSQLKRLDVTNAKRLKIRDRYNEAFGYSNESLYLYRVMLSNRDEFIKYMRKKGIACGVHYKPMHMMNAYKHTKFIGTREFVEHAYEHTASIPFYADMTDEQVDTVINAVEEWRFKE